MRKKLIYTTILFALICYIFVLKNWRIRDVILEYKHDLTYNNQAITSKHQIDQIFAEFEPVVFSELDETYLTYSKSDTKKYKSLVNDLTYFKVKISDLNKYIVGRYRLKNFICKDKFYKTCVLNKRNDIICSLNKKVIYKTLELQQELEKQGYNKNGFRVVNGHRHPRYNEKVGGAKRSRHIKGEAVDISICDINQDGMSNKKDKDIVLDLLENKIIKNEGGVGLYPGTQSVHYDVRGTRARWNSY